MKKLFCTILAAMTLASVMCVQAFAASTDEVNVPNYVKCPICIENIKADPSCALGIPRWDHEHTDPVTGKTNTYSGKTGEIIEANKTVYSSNDIFVTYDFDDPMNRYDGTPEYMAGLEDCFTTGSMGSAEATGNMGNDKIGDSPFPGKVLPDDNVTFVLKDGVLVFSGDGEFSTAYSFAFANNRNIETVIFDGSIIFPGINHLPNLKNIIRLEANEDDYKNDGTWNSGREKAYRVNNCPKVMNNIGPKALEDMGANAIKATIESMNLPAWALAHLPASVGGTDGTVIDNRPVATMQVSEWARDYVQTAIDAGIIPSYMMSMDFTKAITRAEFCIFAVETIEHLTGAELTTDAYDAECSFQGWETIQPFDDIFDTYAQAQTAIKKLYGLNIITGYGNGKFGPNDTLTREQSAVILTRLAEAVGKPMPLVATPFTDTNTDWSADGISACYGAGVMTGTTATTFDPLAPYTAEQSVVTMVRLMEYMNK